VDRNGMSNSCQCKLRGPKATSPAFELQSPRPAPARHGKHLDWRTDGAPGAGKAAAGRRQAGSRAQRAPSGPNQGPYDNRE
jgi:hypothetical protein